LEQNYLERIKSTDWKSLRWNMSLKKMMSFVVYIKWLFVSLVQSEASCYCYCIDGRFWI
jgi:hypothetical protein